MAVSPPGPSISRGHSVRSRTVTYLSNQKVLLALIVVLLFVAFGTLNPNFYNDRFVIAPLLQSAALYTVVGLAQMCVLAIGQMNLAIGRMAALGAMAAGASLQFWNVPLWLGALIGILCGALVGYLAGWIIVKTNVNSFIVTLAMDFVLLGFVTLTYASLTGTTAFSVNPEGFAFLRETTFANICLFGACGPQAIPILVVPTLLIAGLVYFLFARLRVGREILATGASVRASELSGIPSNRRILLAHVMCGVLAAVAGIMLAAMSGSFSASIGAEFLLPSFLGPVLGGTLLAGGVVSIVGTILGTLITLIIRQGLTVAGAGIDTLNIALGAILLAALSLQRLQTLRRKRNDKEVISE